MLFFVIDQDEKTAIVVIERIERQRMDPLYTETKNYKFTLHATRASLQRLRIEPSGLARMSTCPHAGYQRR
ncbi:hypothetical protein A5760_21000 [Mycobacterium colombiense]|uniref:Uncharacterized protein n=1 Tax=Mycobacterium colombiense TaxID=339268 RepID=A0A1A0V7J7_9MYCO|nr:hypothetical protein A5760_21000 [Mycobacterium colombiense]